MLAPSHIIPHGPKLPLPLWGCGPHLIHGSLGFMSPHPKRLPDQLSRFCRGHGCVRDRQTDWPTDALCYNVCGNRLHCMLCLAIYLVTNHQQLLISFHIHTVKEWYVKCKVLNWFSYTECAKNLTNFWSKMETSIGWPPKWDYFGLSYCCNHSK